MSGFSAEWLALREPLDLRARNARGARCCRSGIPGQARALDRRSRQRHRLDGAGARAAAAENAKLEAGRQRSGAAGGSVRAARPAGVAVETQQFDLNGDVGPLFDDGADLVTASALLDLVSEPWLANFAAAAAARSLPVYVALTYDGRVSFRQRRSRRCGGHRRGQRASARQQGLWSGARSACGGVCEENLSRARLFDRARKIRLGAPRRPTRNSRLELLAGWLQAAREMGEPVARRAGRLVHAPLSRGGGRQADPDCRPCGFLCTTAKR